MSALESEVAKAASEEAQSASGVASARLNPLLEPRSVAVLGLSDRRPTWGNRAARACKAGGVPIVYGVSPRAPLVGFEGIEVVRRLRDIPEPVDCALVAVSNERTLSAIEDCAEHGVRAAVIVGVGFGELGGDGAVLQRRLVDVAASTGMRLLGPNCIGAFRARSGLCFTPFVPPAGSVALITQSGNVAIYLSLLASRYQFGLSTCVGVGNQVDVSFADLLGWLAADSETSTVALYAEGLPPESGRRFMDELRACRGAGKAVVVLRGGETDTGSATAATHTASLAGNREVWRAVLDWGGAVTVSSVPEMAEAIAAAESVPRIEGAVMVLTDGGGDSVMTVDALSRCRIPLARLGAETQRELAELLPRWAPRHEGLNPVTLDTPGGLQDDPMLLVRCASAVSRDSDVAALVIAGLFGGYAAHRAVELEAATRLVELRRSGLPILVASAYDGFDDEVTSVLRRGGVAVYSSSHQLVSALATRVRVAAAPLPPSPLSSAPPTARTIVLPTEVARRVLVEAGVPCPEIRIVEPAGDLEVACLGLTPPLCVKLELPGIAHKSEVHGVRLDLDLGDVRAAASDLWSRYPEASLVLMPSFPRGFELLVGITWDELFGPAVVVGRGGIWAEVERDTTVVLPSLSRDELMRAVWRLRCAPMIAGGRGQPALDSEALVDLLRSICELATRADHLSVDLNPVILYERGLAVVDFTVTAPPGYAKTEGPDAC